MPKLILLDMKLPEVDGIDVLREVRYDPRARAVPSVALTSSKEEQDKVQSSKLRINGYILKPVDIHQFREKVKRFVMSWLLVGAPTPDGVLAEK